MLNTIKTSNFDTLFNKIPKKPELWTEEDVASWLTIIGMEIYALNFAEMRVNGLLILELSEEDLKKEIKITIKLHRKRILKEIELLNEYTLFLGEMINDPKYQNKKNNEEREIIKEEPLLDYHVDSRSPHQLLNVKYIIEDEPKTQVNDKSKSKRYITVKSIEGPNDMNFKVEADGIKIGRHSSNQIVIFDESVSRYHAEIVFVNEFFYLKDVGSTAGTFLKITEPLELKLNMILEVGSYQLKVNHIEIAADNDKESYVEFTIYESPKKVLQKKFYLYSNNSIGRKTTNTLSFTDDLYMSNLHCKIDLIRNKFFLEDIASTNGSWLRLTPQGNKSGQFLLRNTTIFKIGNSAVYEVYDISSPVKIVKVEDNNDMQNDNQKTIHYVVFVRKLKVIVFFFLVSIMLLARSVLKWTKYVIFATSTSMIYCLQIK